MLWYTNSTASQILTSYPQNTAVLFQGGSAAWYGFILDPVGSGEVCATQRGIYLASYTTAVSGDLASAAVGMAAPATAFVPAVGAWTMAQPVPANTTVHVSSGSVLDLTIDECLVGVASGMGTGAVSAVASPNASVYLAVSAIGGAPNYLSFTTNSSSTQTISGTVDLTTVYTGSSSMGSALTVYSPGIIRSGVARLYVVSYQLDWTGTGPGYGLNSWLNCPSRTAWLGVASSSGTTTVSALALAYIGYSSQCAVQVYTSANALAANATFTIAAATGDYSCVAYIGSPAYTPSLAAGVPFQIGFGSSGTVQETSGSSVVTNASATTFTVTAAGVYLVDLQGIVADSPTPPSIALWFQVTRLGAQRFGYQDFLNATFVDGSSLVASTHAQLVLQANDVVTMWALVNAPCSLYLANTYARTNMMYLGPLDAPTMSPTTGSPSQSPSGAPSRAPSRSPSKSPTLPTHSPSRTPSRAPSKTPSLTPTHSPSRAPSKAPSRTPSRTPSSSPSRTPTATPTMAPVACSVFVPI